MQQKNQINLLKQENKQLKDSIHQMQDQMNDCLKREIELRDQKMQLEQQMHECTTNSEENEELINTLGNNLPDGIFFKAILNNDKSLFFNYLSPNFKKITGIDPEKFKNNNPENTLQYIHPDDREYIHAKMLESFHNHSDFDAEFRITTLPGPEIWLLVKSRPQKITSGYICYYGYILDISERKQAEQLLHIAHYSIDKNKNPIFWFGSDGRFQYVNEAACETLGYEEYELLNMHVYDISEGMTIKDWKETWMYLKKNKFRIREFYHKRKDGSTFPVKVSSDYLYFEDREYVFSIANDITTRKRAETALKQSEDRYRKLVEYSPLPIIVHCNYKIIYINQAAIETLKWENNKEHINKPVLDIIHPDHIDQTRIDIANVYIRKRDIPLSQNIFLRSDGTSVTVEMASTYIDIEGESGSQVVFMDITDRWLTEELLTQSERNYREIFNSTSDAILIYHPKTGEILDMNDTAQKMYNIPADEALNISVNDISQRKAPFDEQEMFTRMEASINEGMQKFEWLAKKYTGELFWTEIYLKYTKIGDENKLLAVVRDISERKRAEKELETSEIRLKMALEATTDAIWDLDLTNNKIFLSPRYYDMLDYRKDESIEDIETFKMIIHPDELKIFDKVLNEYRDKPDENFEIEHRLKTKYNDWKWVLSKGRVYPGEDNRITRIIGTISDITERKIAEQALKESEEKYRILFTTATDAIFMMKGDKFIDCNPATSKMFECTRNQILNKSPYKFSPVYQPDGKLSETKARKYINNALKGKPQFFEWQHTTFKNKVFDAEISLSRIELGGEKFLQSIVRNITDRKKAEKNLRASEEKFRNIFNNSSDAMLISDTGRNLIEINKVLVDLSGFRRTELLKKRVFDLFTGLSDKQLENIYIKLLDDQHIPSFESELLTDTNRFIPVEINWTMTDYAGQAAILTIIRDITERKEVEKRVLDAIIFTEEREREKFARNLHDDLGPLLSSIKMYVNSIHTMNEPKKQLYIISQLNEIVKEAIGTTKEISNDLSPHILTNYGLVSAVESFISKIQQGILFDFDTNLGDLRFSNELEISLYRIIKELVNNTIKHANARKIKIKLYHGENQMTLKYYDNGKGMTISQIKENIEGMGLSNIFSRSRSLKGKYNIYSEKNQGFHFDLEFPAIPIN